MIFPKNGQVVIIDDKIEEVSSLMEILSINGVSYTYFKGDQESLPKNPLKNISLVFLDLELFGSGVDDATKASQDIKVLQSILGEDKSAFESVLIIVWSNDVNILKELKPRMKSGNISPLAFIEIEKQNCQQNGNFDFLLINNAINDKLKDIPAIKLLYYWNNLVGEAAIDVYKKIIPKNLPDLKDINTKLHTIYHELAEACMGKKINNHAHAACLLLNAILANEINKKEFQFDLDSSNIAKLSFTELGILNYDINTVSETSVFSPGCIIRNKSSHQVDLEELFNNNEQHLRNCIKSYAKKLKIADDSKLSVEEMAKTLKKIMPSIVCEVTPLCDYSQKRQRMHRLLPGRLIPAEIKNIKKSDFFYNTPVFFKKGIQKDPFYVVFDLRKLFTNQLTYYKSPKILFKFGSPLLMHIQNSLGRQISNPGITSLQFKK